MQFANLKFAKLFFIVTTPIGLAVGLWEGYRLAGGLVFLMAVQIGALGLIAWRLVAMVRREARSTRAQDAHTPQVPS